MLVASVISLINPFCEIEIVLAMGSITNLILEAAFASHFELCVGKSFDKVVDIFQCSDAPIVDIQDH
jgi:hypothetical protein